jgi:hypothetical protein
MIHGLFKERGGYLGWMFETPAGKHWNGKSSQGIVTANEIDYFIDKVFEELAPGESLIRSMNLPDYSNNKYSLGFNPTFPIPRRISRTRIITISVPDGY